MKKKTLVPLIIFLLGICLVSLIVYKTDTHEKEQRHITAQLNDKLKVENGKLKANPYDDKQVYILRPCMIQIGRASCRERV